MFSGESEPVQAVAKHLYNKYLDQLNSPKQENDSKSEFSSELKHLHENNPMSISVAVYFACTLPFEEKVEFLIKKLHPLINATLYNQSEPLGLTTREITELKSVLPTIWKDEKNWRYKSFSYRENELHDLINDDLCALELYILYEYVDSQKSTLQRVANFMPLPQQLLNIITDYVDIDGININKEEFIRPNEFLTAENRNKESTYNKIVAYAKLKDSLLHERDMRKNTNHETKDPITFIDNSWRDVLHRPVRFQIDLTLMPPGNIHYAYKEYHVVTNLLTFEQKGMIDRSNLHSEKNSEGFLISRHIVDGWDPKHLFLNLPAYKRFVEFRNQTQFVFALASFGFIQAKEKLQKNYAFLKRLNVFIDIPELQNDGLRFFEKVDKIVCEDLALAEEKRKVAAEKRQIELQEVDQLIKEILALNSFPLRFFYNTVDNREEIIIKIKNFSDVAWERFFSEQFSIKGLKQKISAFIKPKIKEMLLKGILHYQDVDRLKPLGKITDLHSTFSFNNFGKTTKTRRYIEENATKFGKGS